MFYTANAVFDESKVGDVNSIADESSLVELMDIDSEGKEDGNCAAMPNADDHANERMIIETTESTESTESKPMASESMADEPESMAIESMENTASTGDAASNAGETWELPNRRYRIRLGEEILDDEPV